ncbi:MAG: hypothetical protein ABSB19_07085 [Methylomonas sp.]|jgi:hypothetical protein
MRNALFLKLFPLLTIFIFGCAPRGYITPFGSLTPIPDNAYWEQQYDAGTIDCKAQPLISEQDCVLGVHTKAKPSKQSIEYLKSFGITTPEQYDATIVEKNKYIKYSSLSLSNAPNDTLRTTLSYLQDKKIADSQNITINKYLDNIQDAADKKQKEIDKEQKEIDKEFIFEAIISCGNSEYMACFTGSVSTEIELRNGKEYGMYKPWEFSRIQHIVRNNGNLVILLRKDFEIAVQNSSDFFILNLKVRNRKTGEIYFNKSASIYQRIAVKY